MTSTLMNSGTHPCTIIYPFVAQSLKYEFLRKKASQVNKTAAFPTFSWNLHIAKLLHTFVLYPIFTHNATYACHSGAFDLCNLPMWRMLEASLAGSISWPQLHSFALVSAWDARLCCIAPRWHCHPYEGGVTVYSTKGSIYIGRENVLMKSWRWAYISRIYSNIYEDTVPIFIGTQANYQCGFDQQPWAACIWRHKLVRCAHWNVYGRLTVNSQMCVLL